MLTLFTLKCILPIDGSFKEIEDSLEVSLPCSACKRNRRTIVFKNNSNGYCTPKDKCNGFNGKITDIKIVSNTNETEIVYKIEFDYTPFFDEKYNQPSDFNHGWARIYFNVECSACGMVHRISTQENLGRPFKKVCECGHKYYEESKSPFEYIPQQ